MGSICLQWGRMSILEILLVRLAIQGPEQLGRICTLKLWKALLRLMPMEAQLAFGAADQSFTLIPPNLIIGPDRAHMMAAHLHRHLSHPTIRSRGLRLGMMSLGQMTSSQTSRIISTRPKSPARQSFSTSTGMA